LNTVASDSLLWIKRELDETLQRSRQSLEAYVEDQEDERPLTECLEHLHQVQGTLRIVEVYGAAMLAEEMEAVAKALAGNRIRERNEAFEVLMRAMIQLPDYLERVVSGQRDVPLALLSLLNDLRSVRGEPLLSESALFSQNLSERGAQSVAARVPAGAGDASAVAKQLRPKFQSALLGWYRGDAKSPAQLKALCKVAEQLEHASSTPSCFQLWWVVGGVLEALSDDGLEATVSVKQMLGQVDRQLKRLADEGEAVIEADPPAELVNNLLFYVGKATSRGERIAALKDSFRLGEILPDDSEVEQTKRGLTGPNMNLMRTVSAALKEDLARIKDALDIFVRTKSSNVGELGELPELLKKVGDTLAVLGLGALREACEGQRHALSAVVAGTDAPTDSLLMDVAAALIRVESTLDRQMSDIVTGETRPRASEEVDGLRVEEGDFREVTAAVIRESIINLARVKDAIVEFVKNTSDRAVLEPLPALIHQIVSGLTLLEMSRAGEVLLSVSRYLRKRVPQGTPATHELDRLADAIVSVEFFLETVQQGRGSPVSMLENAESCVKALGFPVGEALPDDDDVPMVPLPPVGAGVEAQKVRSGPPISGEPTHVAVEPPTLMGAQVKIEEPAPRHQAKPAVVARPEEVDPEIVEIFLEESKEEINSLRDHFPRWREHPDMKEELTTVRRSFHTLKGSGRMVGAEMIGEFAWSMENMLNRVLDQTVSPGPEMFGLLERAIKTLPELIEQLESGAPPKTDVGELMESAHAIARGEFRQVHPEVARAEVAEPLPAPTMDPVPEIAAPTPPPLGPDSTLLGDFSSTLMAERVEIVPVAAPEHEPEAAPVAVPGAPAATGTGMDPVLYEIFGREVAGHLDVAEAFVATAAGHAAPITDDLARALHTLAGSAGMAGATRIAAVVEPLERYARAAADAGATASPQFLAVLKDALAAVRDMHATLAHSQPKANAYANLAQRGLALPQPEVSSAQVASGAAPRTIALAELGEFDPELAAVFLEEANELLEATDSALAGWQRERNNAQHVGELQRHLHTLKGGARMAGISPMGDLSHEMESMLTEVVDGRQPMSTAMFAVAQRSVDRLHRMLEQVYAKQPIVDGTDLVAEMQRLIRGEHEEPAITRVLPQPVAAAHSVDAAAFEAEAAAAAAAAAEVAAAEARYTPEPARPGAAKPEFAEAHSFDTGEDRRRGSRMEAEMVRVRADILQSLLDVAGEVSIYRARLGQQVNTINFNLKELEQTVVRLREQLRRMEIETEAQIRSQFVDQANEQRADFDPLELDQYSTLQQLSRALAESVNDLLDLKDTLVDQAKEADTLLLQQARANTALQDGLMRTRMLPLTRHAQRLRRIVRQTADEVGKAAELRFVGAEGEIDREVLERIVAPLEHMLRNSVIHGIESKADRAAAGKPPAGTVAIKMHREGSEVVMLVEDDGAGLDLDAIRRKASSLGLMRSGIEYSDYDVMQFILESGFSTAKTVTQAAGRGVGMDVVASEIKQLGGSFHIDANPGKGARFTIRLPFTLAITQALVVQAGESDYAIPLPSIEGIVRIRRKDLIKLLEDPEANFNYGGIAFDVYQLGVLLGAGAPTYSEELDTIPVILVRAGDHAGALVTEGMSGSREIVVKSVGPQVSSIRGVSGATILGDGSILLILDAGGLVRHAALRAAAGKRIEAIQRVEAEAAEDKRIFAMVVDDSITVRRVTQRLLERFGFRVITAKDGVDALALLQENTPDVMLLDIEMPRMDGYELAQIMKGDERFKGIPIIMITSRTGEKHRARAAEIGVERYLGKPYQEEELIETIHGLVGRFDPSRTSFG
jgi:chemosensory pili system protein ChpA (sensor histidine kinase/response regulator)